MKSILRKDSYWCMEKELRIDMCRSEGLPSNVCGSISRMDVNTNAYLFLTQRGTTLSPRGVQIVFRSLKKKLNLDGRKLSPHLLRHSFALAYIENGGDPFSLQRILGHTDQTTTSKYVNMARSNVKAQHSKYSPGEKLG